MRADKHSGFQSASVRIALVEIILNQYEHKISRVIVIVVIHHFLDPKSYGSVYLTSHIIFTILEFSLQLILRKDRKKKTKTNIPLDILCPELIRTPTTTTLGLPRIQALNVHRQPASNVGSGRISDLRVKIIITENPLAARQTTLWVSSSYARLSAWAWRGRTTLFTSPAMQSLRWESQSHYPPLRRSYLYGQGQPIHTRTDGCSSDGLPILLDPCRVPFFLLHCSKLWEERTYGQATRATLAREDMHV